MTPSALDWNEVTKVAPYYLSLNHFFAVALPKSELLGHCT